MEKFDLWTHKRNRDGKITVKNAYRMVVDKDGRKFERPKNSGNWFYENGEEVSHEELVKCGLKKEAAPVVTPKVTQAPPAGMQFQKSVPAVIKAEG